MEPENESLEEEIPTKYHHFPVPMLVLGGVILIYCMKNSFRFFFRLRPHHHHHLLQLERRQICWCFFGILELYRHRTSVDSKTRPILKMVRSAHPAGEIDVFHIDEPMTSPDTTSQKVGILSLESCQLKFQDLSLEFDHSTIKHPIVSILLFECHVSSHFGCPWCLRPKTTFRLLSRLLSKHLPNLGSGPGISKHIETQGASKWQKMMFNKMAPGDSLSMSSTELFGKDHKWYTLVVTWISHLGV